MACYISWTMLYLNIRKGEDDTKTAEFQYQIRGTTVCMKIIIMAIKGCVKMMSNYIYFYKTWFGGVKTAEGAVSEVVDYYGPVR